jgi:hypothetical protein
MQETRHNLNYSYTVKDDAYARPTWSRPEPELLQDISIFGIDGLSNDNNNSSHQAGNCLPTTDELRRLERPRPRRAMPWAKWAVSMVVAVACLLWIIIGVSRRHDDGGGLASSASTTEDNNNAKTLTGVGDSGASAAGTFDRSASNVIAYLVENKISSTESLQDSNSAQYKAVQWLVNNDGNPWTLPTVPLTQRDGYVFAARYVLVRSYTKLRNMGTTCSHARHVSPCTC